MQHSLFGAMAVAEPPVKEPDRDALSVPLEEAIFTVMDLETTGLNPKKNAITEICAIKYQNGVELEKLVTFVKPNEEIPPEIQDITGITDEMVQNAPPLVMALSDLGNFVGPNPLVVGHNIGFDIGFIREKLYEAGLASFMTRFEMPDAFCTKVLARKVLPSLPSYEAIVVATQFGIQNPQAHRAEHDVKMTGATLFKLFEQANANGAGLKTLGDLYDYQTRLQ
ncbi:MAG: 3'-5' exonuclease [Vampirovibrio sp.]|nr:3'-5' exonuclease [Vampirovibrio sp.]